MYRRLDMPGKCIYEPWKLLLPSLYGQWTLKQYFFWNLSFPASTNYNAFLLRKVVNMIQFIYLDICISKATWARSEATSQSALQKSCTSKHPLNQQENKPPRKRVSSRSNLPEVFLIISQNPQKNTSAGFAFLIS